MLEMNDYFSRWNWSRRRSVN